jgi:predicted DNA-binding antitoxin AbrB/MazE fold protein
MENKVLQPLRKVLELSDGPSRLIQKRNDKLLDYESCLSKTEKNKDIKVNEIALSSNQNRASATVLTLL